jgi:hypothetical protein
MAAVMSRVHANAQLAAAPCVRATLAERAFRMKMPTTFLVRPAGSSRGSITIA